jgi:hypothetical protein
MKKSPLPLKRIGFNFFLRSRIPTLFAKGLGEGNQLLKETYYIRKKESNRILMEFLRTVAPKFWIIKSII